MPASALSKEAPFADIHDGIALAHAIVETVGDPRGRRGSYELCAADV